MFKSFVMPVALAVAALTALHPLSANAASQINDSPSATPIATCDVPNVSAATVYGAQPETPVLATTMQLTGTAYVRVDLDAAGNVQNASIAKSSGAYILDRAAINAAKQSSFRPELRDCAPVAGTYLFVVDFP
jgi:TonB family protein